MLKQRLLVIAILVPLCIILILAGGWALYIPFAASLGIIGWEYWMMFRKGGYRPDAAILIGGIPILFLAQAGFGFIGRNLVMTVLLFLTLIMHIVRFERGQEQAVINLSISLTGLLCVGWLGSYLIPLRSGSDGMWWTFLVVAGASFGDMGGYIFGHLFGRHRMFKRISPSKTLEGYVGGVTISTITTGVLASFFHVPAPFITPLKGMLLGFAISSISPLGDLTVSLFKRTFGLKDTSNLIPGHGGFWDRFDTVLWAIFIGYFLINCIWFQQVAF